MSVVRAAKKFELVFNFLNINFQTIFGRIIKHEVNYLFTRTLNAWLSLQRGCAVRL